MKRNKNIVIFKPDKGTGTVILKKIDYINKMEVLLNDKFNFKKCTDDLYKTVIMFEDKNNRLIEHLYKNSGVNEVLKKLRKTVGSRRGIMYVSP